MCKVSYWKPHPIYELPPSLNIKATKPNISKYHGIRVYYLSTAIFDLISVHELLKEVYSIALKNFEVHTEYRMISKTFGTISQCIGHEDNIACLKIFIFPNISPQTKHISISFHFFKQILNILKLK